MLRLLSGPLSLFTGKVRIALDEKDVPCAIQDVPFSRRGYDPKPAEVLARNPRGQVPILVEDDGFTVYDSTLILAYLEDRYPEPPLLPAEPRARARCRQLEAVADEELFPHVWTLIQQRFYAPDPAAQDGAAIDAATRAIGEHVARLDAALAGGGPWVCGAPFTIADIGWFMTLDFARRLGVDVEAAPAGAARWWARINERPSVARERARLDAATARVLAG